MDTIAKDNFVQVIPLLPNLEAAKALKCDHIRVYRDVPSDGYIDRVPPNTTTDEIKNQYGGGKFRYQAIGHDHGFLGQYSDAIGGDPISLRKKDGKGGSLPEVPPWAYQQWGPPPPQQGADTIAQTFSLLEQRSLREQEDHKRAMERAEVDRRAEAERRADETKLLLQKLEMEKQVAEAKAKADLEKFERQLAADRERQKEEARLERERREEERRADKEEAKLERERRDEERLREREWMTQQAAVAEKAAKEDRERQRDWQKSMTDGQREFTSALLAANKKDDGGPKLLEAIKFGLDIGHQPGPDPMAGLASTIAMLAQEKIRENRERRIVKLRRAWQHQRPGTRPQGAPQAGEPRPNGGAPTRPAQTQQPNAVIPPKGLGGPPMTPIAQMAVVAAVKNFSPETLVAMVFDLYENGEVSDQTMEILKGLPEGEIVRRFVVYVNSSELLPHKDKLFAAAQILRRELMSSDGAPAPTPSGIDSELQEALTGGATAPTEAPVAPTTPTPA